MVIYPETTILVMCEQCGKNVNLANKQTSKLHDKDVQVLLKFFYPEWEWVHEMENNIAQESAETQAALNESFAALEQMCADNEWELNVRYSSKLAKGTKTSSRRKWGGSAMGKWFVIVKVVKETENYKAYDDDLARCIDKVVHKIRQVYPT